jgi:hypothetical protein
MVIEEVCERTMAKIVSDEKAPVPTLASLQPACSAVGAPDLIMKCTGTNFDLRSVIFFNGDPSSTIRHRCLFLRATE